MSSEKGAAFREMAFTALASGETGLASLTSLSCGGDVRRCRPAMESAASIRPPAAKFILTSDVTKRKKRKPMICGGQVLALMDMMEEQQCTMNHLHELTKVGYATIYTFLQLKTFPSTLVIAQLVFALGYEHLEFAWIAHLNVSDF